MQLEFVNVICRYGRGRPVLSEVSLRLGRGLWTVSGPNGAGKSTLLRCAAGLLPPDRGRLLWNGVDAVRLGGRYRWHLGYMPQEPAAYPDLTARAYLHYLAALKGIRHERQSQRVAEMLDLVGLTACADRLPSGLSAGMKGRLALAQALLNDPDLLLLDEPQASLDPEEQVRFRLLLADLALDRIVLAVTSRPEDLKGTAEGEIRLQGGRLASFTGERQGVMAGGD